MAIDRSWIGTDDDGSGETGTVVNAAYIGTFADAIDDALADAAAAGHAPRVQAVTSSATVTPNADSDDMVVVTAQAAAVNFANPSPATTVTQGAKLIIRIKDNGTARAITYGTQYRAMGTALPSTTVLSKTLYLGFVWNATDSKWDLVAAAQEA